MSAPGRITGGRLADGPAAGDYTKGQHMNITNTADDALVNVILRALVNRDGGRIEVGMPEVHAAAGAGELRWHMTDDGRIVMRLLPKAAAQPEPNPAPAKPARRPAAQRRQRVAA